MGNAIALTEERFTYSTLVLGAGSSIGFNYPTGIQLRERIIEECKTLNSIVPISAASGKPDYEIRQFAEAFRNSSFYSIDAFLMRNEKYASIGKAAIAHILCRLENINRLPLGPESDNKDHWQAYFFNELRGNHTWKSLPLRKFKVVTFNYDRSFEHFLGISLSAGFDIPFNDCMQRIKDELEIIHVYGSLGAIYPSESNYMPYENISNGPPAGNQRKIQAAANNIRVIGEGRADDSTIKRVHEVLSGSLHIAFLGFGFDDTNVERLNTTATCALRLKCDRGNGPDILHRNVYATTYGLPEKRITLLHDRVIGARPPYEDVLQFFMNTTCTGLLENTQFVREAISR